MRIKRETVTSALEVAGAASVTVGASLAASAAGWIVGGLLALAYAWRMTS